MKDISAVISNSTTNYSKFIYWYLGNKCNYRCSYCHPDYYNGQHYWHPQELVVSVVNKFKNSLVIFSGGEPTFHPNLLDIFQNIDNSCTLGLVSNGSRPLHLYENLIATRKKTRVIFSYHYKDVDHDDFFHKAVALASNDKCEFVITFLLPTDHHWDNCLDFYYKLKNQGLIVQPKLRFENYRINNIIQRDQEYTEEQVTWALKENNSIDEGIMLYDNKFKHLRSVSSQYLLADNITNFVGWKCFAKRNNLLIYPNGDVVTGLCAQHSKLGNIFTSINYEPTAAETCRTNLCNGWIDIHATKIKNFKD